MNCLKKIIKAGKRDNFKFYLGQNCALYAALQKRHGNQPKTRQYLSKAIQIFEECGANGWAVKHKTDMMI